MSKQSHSELGNTIDKTCLAIATKANIKENGFYLEWKQPKSIRDAVVAQVFQAWLFNETNAYASKKNKEEGETVSPTDEIRPQADAKIGHSQAKLLGSSLDPIKIRQRGQALLKIFLPDNPTFQNEIINHYFDKTIDLEQVGDHKQKSSGSDETTGLGQVGDHKQEPSDDDKAAEDRDQAFFEKHIKKLTAIHQELDNQFQRYPFQAAKEIGVFTDSIVNTIIAMLNGSIVKKDFMADQYLPIVRSILRFYTSNGKRNLDKVSVSCLDSVGLQFIACQLAPLITEVEKDPKPDKHFLTALKFMFGEGIADSRILPDKILEKLTGESSPAHNTFKLLAEEISTHLKLRRDHNNQINYKNRIDACICLQLLKEVELILGIDIITRLDGGSKAVAAANHFIKDNYSDEYCLKIKETVISKALGHVWYLKYENYKTQLKIQGLTHQYPMFELWRHTKRIFNLCQHAYATSKQEQKTRDKANIEPPPSTVDLHPKEEKKHEGNSSKKIKAAIPQYAAIKAGVLTTVKLLLDDTDGDPFYSVTVNDECVNKKAERSVFSENSYYELQNQENTYKVLSQLAEETSQSGEIGIKFLHDIYITHAPLLHYSVLNRLDHSVLSDLIKKINTKAQSAHKQYISNAKKTNKQRHCYSIFAKNNGIQRDNNFIKAYQSNNTNDETKVATGDAAPLQHQPDQQKILIEKVFRLAIYIKHGSIGFNTTYSSVTSGKNYTSARMYYCRAFGLSLSDIDSPTISVIDIFHKILTQECCLYLGDQSIPHIEAKGKPKSQEQHPGPQAAEDKDIPPTIGGTPPSLSSNTSILQCYIRQHTKPSPSNSPRKDSASISRQSVHSTSVTQSRPPSGSFSASRHSAESKSKSTSQPDPASEEDKQYQNIKNKRKLQQELHTALSPHITASPTKVATHIMHDINKAQSLEELQSIKDRIASTSESSSQNHNNNVPSYHSMYNSKYTLFCRPRYQESAAALRSIQEALKEKENESSKVTYFHTPPS